MNNTKTTKDKNSYKQQILCPWWFCFTFDNFLRRLVQNPERVLKPYIMPGWTVLDVGPGMGYFTNALAKLVGDTGRVIAADLQQHMLKGIYRRALKAGFQDRIVLHKTGPTHIEVKEPIDFCLCFWMLHEVPDRGKFLSEIFTLLKHGGLLLLGEPKIHVSQSSFDTSVKIAKQAGFNLVDEPRIFLTYSALLKK